MRPTDWRAQIRANQCILPCKRIKTSQCDVSLAKAAGQSGKLVGRAKTAADTYLTARPTNPAISAAHVTLAGSFRDVWMIAP